MQLSYLLTSNFQSALGRAIKLHSRIFCFEGAGLQPNVAYFSPETAVVYKNHLNLVISTDQRERRNLSILQMPT